MKYQECYKCKEVKLHSEFSKNCKKSNGINTICKVCHGAYRKNYYLDNKETEKRKVNEYRKTHPVKYIYEDNYTKIKNYSIRAGRTIETCCFVCGVLIYSTEKEMLENVRKFCSRYCRSSLNKSNYYHYLQDISKRCKKIKRDFDLDENFLLELLETKQGGKCAITNIPIILKSNKKEELSLYKHASLDRIDSSKGYTKDNVQWVVVGINYMKLDFNESELHELLKLIKQNYTPIA